MTLGEHISNARHTFRTNKLRSALSSLGIIIGVFSVVVLLAFGEGAQQQIVSNIQSLGVNLLTISPGGSQQSNVRTASTSLRSSSNVFTTDESALLSTVSGVKYVSPEQTSRKQIIYQTQNQQVAVYGITPSYLTVHNAEVAYGNFISDENNTSIDKVIVLGSTTATDLFGDANPIGESVRMGNTILTVIGVMKAKGGQGLSSTDSAAFVPLTTMQNRIAGTKYLSSIAVSVESSEAVSGTKLAIEKELMDHFGITDAANANFSIFNQADILSTVSQVTDTLKLFLGAVAVISLIVGGIGVMNIMLVSVTERTREIGIRKAIGARDKDIISQFLSESTVLCVVGGTIGILLSYLIIELTKSLVHGVITINSVVMAFGFSALIGLAFGIFPAYKAARLKPIDALRYE